MPGVTLTYGLKVPSWAVWGFTAAWGLKEPTELYADNSDMDGMAEVIDCRLGIA